MTPATLTINSRNYGSWSMRGWLLCRMAGLDFVEEVLPAGDPATRAELLLLSPSFLVPRLEHAGVTVWDALAIADGPTEVHKLTLARRTLREYEPVDTMFPSAHIPTRREEARARLAEILELDVAEL